MTNDKALQNAYTAISMALSHGCIDLEDHPRDSVADQFFGVARDYGWALSRDVAFDFDADSLLKRLYTEAGI